MLWADLQCRFKGLSDRSSAWATVSKNWQGAYLKWIHSVTPWALIPLVFAFLPSHSNWVSLVGFVGVFWERKGNRHSRIAKKENTQIITKANCILITLYQCSQNLNQINYERNPATSLLFAFLSFLLATQQPPHRLPQNRVSVGGPGRLEWNWGSLDITSFTESPGCHFMASSVSRSC